MDLILSSGFLAFARHLGVLEALQERAVEVDAVVGTSSGALVGALLQAGIPLARVAELLATEPPLKVMVLNRKPWQALFSTDRLVQRLRPYLPARFEELPKPLAVGVCDSGKRHRLIHEGELMPALLASMAIPRLFPAVEIAGCRYLDGGVADRTGVAAWRSWRPNQQGIVHLVARSRGRDVAFDEQGMLVVRTPRARATFWSLGDFASEQCEARELTRALLLDRLHAPG